MHPHSLLELATELLRSVLKFDSPADGLVSMFFRKHAKLGARERHTLAETLYALLRSLGFEPGEPDQQARYRDEPDELVMVREADRVA